MDLKNLENLTKKLQAKGLLENTYEVMGQAKDYNQKLKFAEHLLKQHDLLPNYDEFKQTKCNKKADEFRNLGNQQYKDKKFYESLVSYNKSLCYALKDSQNVGIAFANRSAVYLSMGQYEKCLENIELAKNHKYPKENIDKLNKREEQALEKLNNNPDPNQKWIKYEKARERFLKPTLKAKKNLNFFVADCLEVKTSPEFGRHVITNQDLKVGSVIAVEKPFTKILEPTMVYERCANCLGRNLLNLIPCDNCCSTMFCSADCRIVSQETFHKFECGLVNGINKIFSKNCKIALRNLFEALNIYGTPSNLKEFLDSIKESKATILDFEYTDEASYRLNSLQSIDGLMTNENSQYYKLENLFMFSILSAITCNLMLNHSEALKAVLPDIAGKIFFREFIFKHCQIAAINCHAMYFSESNSFQQAYIGTGIYPFCSLLSHSCAQNIVRGAFDNKMYIVVRQPIKKGEQIFDNYSYRHIDRDKKFRQEMLLRYYHFKCNCEACQKDYPTQLFMQRKRKDLYNKLINMELRLPTPNLEIAVENFDESRKYIT